MIRLAFFLVLFSLLGCDSGGDAPTDIEVVTTADANVLFVGEVTAIGTAGGDRISVAETYAHPLNDPSLPIDRRVTIRTSYGPRIAEGGIDGWRLSGVRIGAFTKTNNSPGLLRVEVYQDGVLIDADEVNEEGSRTRSMMAGDVPDGF